MNFDLMYEQYFDLLGVISGGVFMKNLDDFSYTSTYETTLTVDGETNVYDASQSVNGADARIMGVEIALQRSLDFIPGKFFKNMNIFTNYTFNKIKNLGVMNYFIKFWGN